MTGPGRARRTFLAGMATGLVVLGRRRPVGAQARAGAPAPARGWRIGYLTPSAITPRGIMPDMRQKLRELGYVEGRDLRFEVRSANEDFERLPDLAADLVRSKVDLIVAVSSPAIRAADSRSRWSVRRSARRLRSTSASVAVTIAPKSTTSAIAGEATSTRMRAWR